MAYMPLRSIDLFVDNDIDPGMIVYCEPGLYDIWKRLRYHQWIDHTDQTIDLWKVASSLLEAEKRQKKQDKWPRLTIGMTFSNDNVFPTGATIKGLKIDKTYFPPTSF